MNERTQPIGDEDLHAYVDGTLSDARRADVERALEQSPEMAARVSDYFSLNNLFHERFDRVLGEPVPARLKAVLEAGGSTAAAGAAGASGIKAPAAEVSRPSKPREAAPREAANWPRFGGRFGGMAAALVIGIGIGVAFQASRTPDGFARLASIGQSAGDATIRPASYAPDAPEHLAREAALAHVVYMPEMDRPQAAADAHEQDFVQWLANRMGTDVHPPSLAKSGFELAGGRLLPGDDGQMAQFMYHNDKGERVTLCISRRKINANTTAFRLYQDGPVNVFYWVDGDFGYAVSGGIDRKTLLQLSHDVYEQLTAVSG